MSVEQYVKDTRSYLERAASDGAIPHKVFPFAGNGNRLVKSGVALSLAVRSIDTIELQKAEGDALKAVRAYGYDGADVYGNQGDSALQVERWVHVLARVLVCPDDPSKLITTRDKNEPNPAQIKKLFERDEIEFLYRTWLEFQHSRSVLSTGKLQEALEEARNVGKGLTPAQSLLRFDIATLAFTTTQLARELAAQTNSSSSDTSSENPSSPSSNDSSPGSEATMDSAT